MDFEIQSLYVIWYMLFFFTYVLGEVEKVARKNN